MTETGAGHESTTHNMAQGSTKVSDSFCGGDQGVFVEKVTFELGLCKINGVPR